MQNQIDKTNGHSIIDENHDNLLGHMDKLTALLRDNIDKSIIKNLIPLNSLSEGDKDNILKNGKILTCNMGSYIFRQGEADDFVYYLIEGKVEMQTDEQRSFFIYGGTEEASKPLGGKPPWQYSAKAKTHAKVLKLSKDIYDLTSCVSQDNNEKSLDWMTQILQSNLISKISPDNIQRVFSLFEQRNVKAGDTIIKQGGQGDYLYIIHTGQCQVTRYSTADNEEKILAELKEGESFGEEALIGNTECNATVKMITDGSLVRLKKNDFITLIKNTTIHSLNLKEAKDLVNQGATWLDVRSQKEFENHSLDGSINLPFNTLRKDVNKLDANKQYIVYCDNGARSAIAEFLLMKRGFNVSHLEYGIEKLLHSDNEKKETGVGDGEISKEKHAQEIYEGSPNNVTGINAKQMHEEQNNILSKLNIEQNGDKNALSKVLSVVLSNIYKQLEQVTQEKIEVEVENRILKKKLQNLISKDKNK